MYGNLFVRPLSEETLQQFATTIYDLLGVARFEERESSNYVDETYFVGSALAISLTIALSDDQGFEDYAFWLSLARAAPRGEDDSYLESCGDSIARILVTNGYEVCRALNWGRIGTKRLKYSRHPESDAIETQVENL